MKKRKSYGVIDNDKLFTNWLGNAENTFLPSTVSAKFKSFLKKYKFKDIKLHSLRHANITIMIGNGVDVVTASARAGHSTTRTTMEIYTHFMMENDLIAAEKLDKALAV